MAASIPAVISTPVLSHKQRRAALRKERRKRKRQALAQARESDLTDGAEEDEDVNDGDGEDNGAAEEERLRLHEEWLERERLAQEEFKMRSEKEEAARKRKEEEERLIKEEWDSQQKKEQEEKEQKQQEKRDREPSYSLTKIHSKRKNPHSTFISQSKDEAVQKMLDEAENQLDNKGPWMNPEAPVTVNSENFGTERDIANCPFFLKTGACRFGERCSRKHVHPTASPTLMVRGMFRTFGMEELRRDDYDMDACLEHSEEELHESFLEFYHDVLPEFKSVGKVLQFKVCCNYEPHLRGNVYIQFETEENCKEAFIKFNGRWYAGRQLHCEICPVTRWKNAICGLFDRQKCPKGKHCNFLHVFRNPGNEFWEADRDLRVSPDRSVRGSRRDGWHSERHRERSWRQRHYSRSPETRSERSHSRREDERRRSRSRERRASRQQREDNRSSRSRHSESRTDRHRSRSRDRSRSRGKDGEQHRPRTERRNNDRVHKYRNISEGRDEDTHTEAREKSRSTSREKKRRKQSEEKSPKNSEEMKDGKTHRRHKHSKKSKKSKKKRKKKSHTSNVTTSSEGSEKEESEEETVDDLSTQSPSGDTNNTEITQETCIHESNSSSEVKSELADGEIGELTGNPDNGFS